MGGKICYINSRGESFNLILKELKFQGVFLIEIEKITDERGFFARTWDKKIFNENGLNSNLIQCNENCKL